MEEGALLLFIFFIPFFPPSASAELRSRAAGLGSRRQHAAVLGGKQALCIRVVLRSEPAAPQSTAQMPVFGFLFASVFPLSSVIYYLRRVFFFFRFRSFSSPAGEVLISVAAEQK